MAFAMLKKGRTTFTAEERAKVEVSRYRCFLLGLPEDLLADTPEGVVRIMTARNSTLRQGFDDETCGVLIRATLAAYLPPDHSLNNRLHAFVEGHFSKAFFLRHFLEGDRAAATRMGVHVSGADDAVFAVTALGAGLQMAAFDAANRIPVLKDVANAALVKRVRTLLVRYGHAEYVTDAAQYRPADGAMHTARAAA